MGIANDIKNDKIRLMFIAVQTIGRSIIRVRVNRVKSAQNKSSEVTTTLSFSVILLVLP